MSVSYEDIKNELIGQDEFFDRVKPYLNMAKAGLNPSGRPAGIFFLYGSTGTGKTHAVKRIAKFLHGNENNLLTINCGEYQLDHEVAKLIGAPPGYLGHRETQPVITQQKLAAVSSEASPYSIVLFDEVEKASSSLEKILLGIMDNGSLRLGDGTAVNFERTIVFFTSNVGSEILAQTYSTPFGFGESRKMENVEKAVEQKISKRYAPEFRNRIDEMILFNPLTKSDIAKIVNIELTKLKMFISFRRIKMTDLIVDEKAKNELVRMSYSPQHGAREIRRNIFRHIQAPIAELIINTPTLSSIEVFFKKGKFEFQSFSPETAKKKVSMAG